MKKSRIWRSAAAFLVLVFMLGLLPVGAAAAAEPTVTITPNVTIGGQTVTMTATGLQESFTNFDIGAIFDMPGAFGYTYALWFDRNGTFSFDKNVTLSHQYFDSSFASIGTDEILVRAGEVVRIADGVYSTVNEATVPWSEFTVTLDDGNTWMIIDASEPGSYASTPADTPIAQFPGTVREIDNGIVASGDCGDNLTWTLDGDGVLTISGTGDMQEYGLDAAPWYNMKDRIQTVILENGVTSISSYAFRTCYNLTYVSIPESVTSIEQDAFYNCSSLPTVTIPASVTSIGNGAFLACFHLRSISVSEDNPAYQSVDGVLYSKDGKTIYTYPNGKTGSVFVIPEGVTTISYGAFHATSLEQVLIPSSVSSIEPISFMGSNLTEIEIPDGVRSIEFAVFQSCRSLESITIPASVTSIGDSVFYECDSLRDVYYRGDKKDWAGIQIDLGNDPLLNAALHCSDGDFEPSAEIVASGVCGDDLTWTLDEEGTLTISGTGDMWDYGDLQTPWNAFNSSIRSLSLQEGLTRIGRLAFMGAGITSVTIPNSVREIGTGAFFMCSSLHSLDLGSGVKRIEESAFSSCALNGTLYIPASVEYIAENAFSSNIGFDSSGSSFTICLISEVVVESDNPSYCSVDGILMSKDRSVLLLYPQTLAGYYQVPRGVYRIGSSAFDYSSLEELYISSTVGEIGTAQFLMGSSNLQRITVDSSNRRFQSIDGVLFTKDGKTLLRYPNNSPLMDYEVPAGVTAIGEGAFRDCGSLASVLLPDGVETIGDSAFSGSNQLSAVAIPKSVVSIGSSAFYHFDLYDEILGTSPETIHVYYGGTEEEWNRIRIGGSNNRLDSAAFDFGCIGMQRVTASGVCGDNLTWTLDEEGTLTISGTGDMWDYSLTSPAPWSSYNATNKTVVLPEGLTRIGSYAFYNFSNSISYIFGSGNTLTIPDSVREIGAGAFSSWFDLTGVVFGSGLKRIEANAFDYCSLSGTLTIPASVEYIDETAFSNMGALFATPYFGGLTGVTVEAGNPSYASVDDILMSKDKTALILYPAAKQGTAYAIPGSVTRIGPVAFDLNYYLEELRIPASVSEIGPSSFRNDTALQRITVDAANPSYKDLDGILFTKDGTELVKFPASHPAADYSIPAGVVTTGTSAFTNCSGLRTVSLPASLLSLGDPFASCSGLTQITVDAANPNYKDMDGVLYTRDGTTLLRYPAAKEGTAYSVPAGVVTVGSSAFMNSTGLQEVVLPEGVKTIGIQAFYGCTGLSRLSLPKSLSRVDMFAFYSIYGGSDLQVYYAGSEAEWNSVYVATLNDMLENAEFFYAEASPVTITKQPVSLTVKSGDYAEFRIEAIGENLRYQWQYWNGSGWANTGDDWNSSTDTMSFQTWDGAGGLSFRCVVWNAENGEDWAVSDTVSLTVTPENPVTITRQPVSVTAESGDYAIYSLEATGENLCYQWQYWNGQGWANTGDDWNSGTDTMSFRTWEGGNGLCFRCVVWNAENGEDWAVSDTVSLTVTPENPVTITTQPVSRTAKAGDYVSYRVEATGENLRYQWQYWDGQNWWNTGDDWNSSTSTMSF
ncbi:MAG: leucine-rich repeat domain-containing protein, partial [Oscillospiraceae bacterium]|nr:leucine-rich repeat domain-containing protein [Oscillospiraceae bacterium]